MKKGTVVLLTEEEKQWSMGGGYLRYASCREAGVFNARVGKQSDAFTDQNGLAGELAFCKIFGIPKEQLSIAEPKSALKGEDKGGDVILPGGLTVDVKTTHWPDGRLIAAPRKEGAGVQLYALMTGDIRKDASYTFQGFIRQEELFQDENIEYPGGYGKSAYTAYQFELLDLDQIVAPDNGNT